ncbi:hypothetical protein SYNPS1DRAFT_17778 [Syncephalis pseudoplumigaleata]|uniref:5-formyltetrahydrofolate cyclo-ligase n=1 Tax=Syncephalis pseudoplumigaleata TaxID=1712513 RepID=A0A4P9YVC6_9FUNG|nr:hypothetical protein SYNPS1DRAFT_17778 [Syncephalis pseudoplumigaleata]|eukprot:RKP24013.1 hypothetical protein SYNPS1DRAFT_17778 [Syncephalis pseudoplumigaleata]
MNPSIQSLKKTLRKQLRSRLKLVSPATVAAECNIFISMDGEIETRPIIEDILATGRSCYIPRWQHDTMEMVRLTSLEDFKALPLNAWNIPEPRHDEPRENGS